MTFNASFANSGPRPTGAGPLAHAALNLVKRIRDRVVAQLTPGPVSATDPCCDIPRAPKPQAAADGDEGNDRRGGDVKRWLIVASVLLAAVLLFDLLVLAMTWAPLSVGRSGARATEPRAPVGVARAQAPASAQMRPKASWPIVIAESEPPPEVTMGELRASAAKLLPPTEIREVQGRLLAFGFDPGRVDGTEGPRTRAAAKAYREKRGLVPTGDSVDRNLLAALRSDPSPKAVAPKPRSNAPIDAIVRWWKTL